MRADSNHATKRNASFKSAHFASTNQPTEIGSSRCSRVGSFCSFCGLSLLIQLACSIHATWNIDFSRSYSTPYCRLPSLLAVAVSVEDTVSVGLLLVVQDVGVHRGDEGRREGEPPQRGVQPTPGGHVAPLAPRHHMEQQHSLVSLWKTNARLTATSISYGDIIWNMGRETSDSLSLIRHWLKKKRR